MCGSSTNLIVLVSLVVTGRPEEMEAYVKIEIEKYGKLIRQVGMGLQ